MARLAELADAWTRIENTTQHRTTAFQSFLFCQAFAKWHLGADGDRKLHVVAVYDDDETPVLILPMTVNKRVGTVIAEWLGEPAIQYADIVAENVPDDAAISAAINAAGIYGPPDLFDFRRVREDALIASWLRRHGNPTGFSDQGPYVDLTLSDAELPFLSGKKKKDRRRKRRKIDSRGEVKFEIAEGGERAADLMARSLELKLKWLDEKGLVSRALSQDWVRKALVEIAAQSSDSIVSALKVNEDIASIGVGFVKNRVYYAFLGVINYDYAEASPGDLLTDHDIKWCRENNIERYDYLPPMQRYKQSWTTGATLISHFNVARSWRGAFYARLFVGVVEPMMKSAFHKMPEPLRRRIIDVFNKFRS